VMWQAPTPEVALRPAGKEESADVCTTSSITWSGRWRGILQGCSRWLGFPYEVRGVGGWRGVTCFVMKTCLAHLNFFCHYHTDTGPVTQKTTTVQLHIEGIMLSYSAVLHM
jgi:hypothetical protein